MPALGDVVVMAQPNLLVAAVDDDRRVRESIQSVLESAGYEAAMFGSAEEFLDSGVLPQATCVIADVRLPGLNGLELQRRIRQERAQLPVIFITAHDDDDIRQLALRDGAVDFMVKPFDAAQLLENIERAVNDA
jgi:FixJ family two-component response regulator